MVSLLAQSSLFSRLRLHQSLGLQFGMARLAPGTHPDARWHIMDGEQRVAVRHCTSKRFEVQYFCGQDRAIRLVLVLFIPNGPDGTTIVKFISNGIHFI